MTKMSDLHFIEGTVVDDRIDKISDQIDKASQKSPKAGLVQFRVEEQLMGRLKAMAQAIGTSTGMLCRQWAIEKLTESESQHLKRASDWHKARLAAISEEGQINPFYAQKPYFVLHAVTLNENRTIPPDLAQKSAQALRPIRKGRSYTGRFNHLGYQSFATDDLPAKAYMQIFRSGEIECLRPIWESHIDGVIDGVETDAEIVDAASSACATLAGLQIPLPYAVFISVCKVKDLTMSHGYSPIQVDSFELTPVEIKDWSQISRPGSIEPMAQTLHNSLNVLWNAGGVPSSGTFKDGRWLLAEKKGL